MYQQTRDRLKDTTGASKVLVVIAIMIAAALVGAAVGFAAFQVMVGNHTKTVTYGSSETVEVGSNTTIVPMASSTTPLESYTIYLMGGEDGSNLTFPMDDPYGFSFQDLGDSAKSGTYTSSILLANGVTVEGPTISYTNEITNDITTLVLVPEGDAELDTGTATEEKDGTISKSTENLYKTFQKKIKSLKEDNGKAKVKSGDNLAYISGLCFAQLIDFQYDGVPELVAVYYTKKATQTDSQYANSYTTGDGGVRHYHLGVWEAQQKDDDSDEWKLKCVFSGNDAGSNLIHDEQLAYLGGFFGTDGGIISLKTVDVDDQTYIMAGLEDGTYQANLLGYVAGKFQVAKFLTYGDGIQNNLDGVEGSTSDCEELRKEWDKNVTEYAINSTSSSSLKKKADDTMNTVDDTLDEIEKKLEKAEGSDSDSDDSDD